ncbi:MAG TPA: thiamine pyrophosphate-dependent enzyme [Stellaceae bacterium]|jgi:phosphonopyruvate decarboxylase|nr:thiamine pyrophosphate-dependent enzyme [Stellaceae bacterium]
MITRDEGLRVLARQVPDDIVIAVYSTAFDWVQIRPHVLNYFAVGAMGLASSHGLGLALGRPNRRVIVLDGDGSLLMNLGSLATIANAAPKNFFHFVCENGTYEANGDHPIPGRGRLSFAGLAREAGYAATHEFADLAHFEQQIGNVLGQTGPVLIDLKLVRGAESPRDYRGLYAAERRAAFRAAVMRL